MFRQFLFIFGCIAIASGVGMLSVPAGVIVGGVLLCLIAWAAERDVLAKGEGS